MQGLLVVPMTGLSLWTRSCRLFSASGQTLQDHSGVKGFMEVLNQDSLNQEQWEEAVALNHSCLFDDAGFTGILFGPLALLNESKSSQLELKPLSTAEPGEKRKRRRKRWQFEAPEQSSESEFESEPDGSCEDAQMCLRSAGSIDADMLASQQAQAEETAREALQRLKSKQNSKTPSQTRAQAG